MIRVRVLTLGLLAAGAALYWFHIRNLAPVPGHFELSFWVLAVIFFVAESYVVHFELRQHAHSFTLGEIPVVLGLFLCGPAVLLAAQLVGAGLGLVRRRQPGVKLQFNIANVFLSTTLAITVLHALGGPHPDLSGASLPATFAATITASLVGMVGIMSAIWLSGGERARFWNDSLPIGFAITLSNTGLGIIAVAVVSFRPGIAWVLLVPCLALFLAYRAYTGQREKNQSLQALYESSRMLHRTMDSERAISEILGKARTMFRADLAEMTLFAAKPEDVHVRATLGPDGLRVIRMHELEACDRLASRVALDDSSRLISRTSGDKQLGDEMSRANLRDAMATSLHGNEGVIGTLMVANRLSDVSTFKSKDVKLLETMANNVSAALENIRLADRLRSEAAERRYQALHDSLTGLPNRALFHEHLNRNIHNARQTGRCVAVLLIDLDGFREVNDTLGHQNGDCLLQQVAARLQDALRSEDVVARLGGDEFAVCLPALDSADQAMQTADDILTLVEQVFVVDGIAVEVRASIGVAVSPEHGRDSNLLMQRADVAMYVAKDGHSGCEMYEVAKDRYSERRLSLAAELRQAIEAGEIDVYYQPKARLSDGGVCGAEALARWNHPQRGPVRPDEFIPVAEQTGLVKPLTLYVIDKVLRQVSEWRDKGLEISISVNLSARSLLDLELPDQVLQLLERWSVPPQRLILEITESFIMSDPLRARAVVDRLSEIGVVLAIDDFGTGYSSLAYLKRLPIDELKVDRSFVSDMLTDENDAVIVRSTIELGHNLGLSVVAEGVESFDQWAELASLGCDVAQGYFLSPAVPARELKEWVQTRFPADAALSSLFS
jgi:diguanylate cyclase (GGDEF)-like protein